jgi:gliding-associated putative ABC transporter substrate-binding component GldG
MAITLQERKKQLALTSAAGLAMSALIVILINVLSHWIFFRLDLTQHHAYSLSPSSKQLVRNLSDPVIIKVYFTPDLPPPYNAYERYVKDLLEEYRAASRGKVRFEFVLQSPPDEFEKKAAAAGLVPIQFEEMGSDQFQIRRGYMGLILFHRDKSETLPIVKDVQQLEYDITSRIAKMAVHTRKSVALTTGHGEIDVQSGQSKFAQDLMELYELKTTALSPSATAPITADVVWVAGPKQRFDDKSLWAIDQALMRGIPIFFMVDIKNIMLNQFAAAPLDAGLSDLLKQYGVQIGDRLVYDAQCQAVGMTQNMAGFAFTTSVRYAYIPLIDRIAGTNPMTRGLDTIALPFTTTVEPLQPLPGGIHFTPLFFTSPKSWLAPMVRSYESVAPTNIPVPRPDDPHGPYMVGGLFEGTFTSFFQGKPVPVAGQPFIGVSPKTSIVVLGTSRLLDPNLPPFPGADALASNVLATLSKDETLVGIRSKGEIMRPLNLVSDPVRELVKYGTVLGVAILPVLLGLWRWRTRQHWRQIITTAFAPKIIV